MNKFIEVYDDILNPDLVDYIENLVLHGDLPYKYFSNIARNESTYKPGLNHHFLDSNYNYYTPHYPIFLQVLYNFLQFKKINVLKIIQGRAFLHIPTLDSSPDSIHIDISQPHWVCLYYVNDSDGDTILFDDNENEIKRISPKKGRIVFFDGSIKHCSTPPTKIHRAILNFDFLGEDLGKQ